MRATLEPGQDDRKGLAHFPDPCLASHAGPAPACICLARQPITPLARRQTRQEIAKLFWAPSGPSWCPIAVSPGPHLLYAGPALPWLGPFYSVGLHKTALGLCASTLQARCMSSASPLKSAASPCIRSAFQPAYTPKSPSHPLYRPRSSASASKPPAWTLLFPPRSAYSHPPRPPSYLFPAPLDANITRPFLPIARNQALLFPAFHLGTLSSSLSSLFFCSSPSASLPARRLFCGPQYSTTRGAGTEAKKKKKKRLQNPQRPCTRPPPTSLCCHLPHTQPAFGPSPASSLIYFTTTALPGSHTTATSSDEPFHPSL